MKFDSKKFDSRLPSFFRPLLETILSLGLIPTIVGGTVRDFFLDGVLGKDWDIELRHETLGFNKNYWKDLGQTLSAFGKMTFLPYDVIRVEIQDHQFEFSPPRLEHYREEAKDHSNFDAEYVLNLSFEEAVKRRDFTINAMGIKYLNKTWEHLDPLGGLAHLEKKSLHPAGKDFSKDPVRFLRAHRFAIKHGFDFSGPLLTAFKTMHLGSLTPFYFWSEMQKSGDPVQFLEVMTLTQKNYPDLKLPVNLSPAQFKDLRIFLKDPKKHEFWMIALEWMGYSGEEWRKFFSLSGESTRRLARWAESSRVFQKLLPENFHGEFEKVRTEENFDKLFDWYFSTKQLLQKHPELPLLTMIQDSLPEWIHLYKFEAPKDVKHIDPPLRAKYQVWNLCQRL